MRLGEGEEEETLEKVKGRIGCDTKKQEVNNGVQ